MRSKNAQHIQEQGNRLRGAEALVAIRPRLQGAFYPLAFLPKRDTKLVITLSSWLAKFQSLQEDVAGLKRTLTDENLQSDAPEAQLVELEVAVQGAEVAELELETEQKIPRETEREPSNARQGFGMISVS